MSNPRPADDDVFTTTFLRSGGSDRVAAFQAATEELEEPHRLAEFGDEPTEEATPTLIIPARASG